MDKINTLYFKRPSFCLITEQVVLAQTFFVKLQRPSNSVNLYKPMFSTIPLPTYEKS